MSICAQSVERSENEEGNMILNEIFAGNSLGWFIGENESCSAEMKDYAFIYSCKTEN